jgi:2-oxoisovalerate dehydrogenase E1 component
MGGWMTRYPDPSERIALGEVGVSGEGTDLAIVTFGNGVYLSQQALPQIGRRDQDPDRRYALAVSAAQTEALTAAVKGCRNILIVDETRHSGGVAEALMAHFHEAAPGCLWPA